MTYDRLHLLTASSPSSSTDDSGPLRGVEIDEELGGDPASWRHTAYRITRLNPVGSEFENRHLMMDDVEAFEEEWGYALTGAIRGHVEELQQIRSSLLDVIQSLEENVVLSTLWGRSVKERERIIDRVNNAIEDAGALGKGEPSAGPGVHDLLLDWPDVLSKTVEVVEDEQNHNASLRGSCMGLEVDIPMTRVAGGYWSIGGDDPERAGQTLALLRNIAARLQHFNELNDQQRASVSAICAEYREQMTSIIRPVDDINAALVEAMDEVVRDSRSSSVTKFAEADAKYRLPDEAHEDIINETLGL